MLGGDGGDEIFGGNARYAKQMVFERYFQVPGVLRRGVIEPLVFGLPGGASLPLVRKARSYIEQARMPLPDRMESYNPLHREALEAMFEPGFLAEVDTERPVEWLREPYFRAASQHPINRMLHLDLKFTLADNDLRKVSRMCEAAGVEVRYPLLDDDLVEFSGRLPPDYKVRGARLRWFFKEALKDFLPREIIEKSKHGFGLPFGEWARSHPPLRAVVEQRVTAFLDRGYLRPDYVRTLLRRQAEEHANYYGALVWNVVVLEEWLRANAETSQASGIQPA
jgi:asparagine synthase (glutamine-hydrolysing)